MYKQFLRAWVYAGFCACTLALTGVSPAAVARDTATQADARTDIRDSAAVTARYYAGLLAAPDLAELGLLMNLLPKGGDLHHHYSGAIYAETYLDWVGQAGYCVYREDSAEPGAGKFHIETRPRAQLPAGASALCLDAAAIRDPRNSEFYRALLSRWSDKDYDNHSHPQPAPDQQFFDTFVYFGPVSTYNYNQGLRGLKARAVAENVQYIETMLRSAPARREIYQGEAGKGVDALSSTAGAAEVNGALEPLYQALAGDVQTAGEITRYSGVLEEAAAGIDDDNFKLRFQAYVSRNNPPAQVFAGLYAGFAATQSGGRLVAVNIVGPENWDVSMRDYTLHMRMFGFLKQKFPGVRLALHAGELTLGMVPPEGLQSHIREAVEIGGAQRIGHGVDITYEHDAPALLRLMRERRIPVEISLTSNAFILGVKGAAHPLQVYRRHGVPFVIASDDPGVSRNNLSSEYLLYASRYKPSYAELKQTVYNSIRFAFLGDAEKAVELKKLDQRFAAFEATVRELARPLPPAKAGR
ncbi:MAG: adenosine deaminase [Betaproteobacteria bacterium]|nr:adenosine deaminase [Betaproteobacteria bacterium]